MDKWSITLPFHTRMYTRLMDTGHIHSLFVFARLSIMDSFRVIVTWTPSNVIAKILIVNSTVLRATCEIFTSHIIFLFTDHILFLYRIPGIPKDFTSVACHSKHTIVYNMT